MKKIFDGVVKFNTDKANSVRTLLNKLGQEGQSPLALMITCADSRIVPETMTNTDPGDLFMLRNIGNLVPVYRPEKQENTPESLVGAALEYAIGVIGIRHIIVCGHSDCGAMKAVAKGESLAAHPHLQTWLEHAAVSPQEAMPVRRDETNLPLHDQLAQINVAGQLEHLRSYPCVAQGLARGELHLWGWFFDITQASVSLYNPVNQRFEPLNAESSMLALSEPDSTERYEKREQQSEAQRILPV